MWSNLAGRCLSQDQPYQLHPVPLGVLHRTKCLPCVWPEARGSGTWWWKDGIQMPAFESQLLHYLVLWAPTVTYPLCAHFPPPRNESKRKSYLMELLLRKWDSPSVARSWGLFSPIATQRYIWWISCALFIRSTLDGDFTCFQFGALTSSPPLKFLIQKYMENMYATNICKNMRTVSGSSRIPQSESISFSRYHQPVFQSGRSNLNSC